MESTNNLDKILDTMSSVTKLAANVTEKKSVPALKPLNHTSDDSNKATTGSQSVNLVVDTGKKKEPKPVEKHIHEFPDNRALTEQECELALKKAQMEYDIKREEQLWTMKVEDRNWQHKIEQEKKYEKSKKRAGILAAIFAALGVGCIGYGVYRDFKHGQNSGNCTISVKTVPAPALPETTTEAGGKC